MKQLIISWIVSASLIGAPLTLANDNDDAAVAQGRAVAFDRSKGNCLACHAMGDGTLAGTVGPPMVQMRLRFPDRAVLREQLWDAGKRNPNTLMPPFGRHEILTEEEIDRVVDYLYTL